LGWRRRMKPIGHTVLRRGDIITSPTKKQYIVVDTTGEEILIAAIGRHSKKSISDISKWNLHEEDDRRSC